MIPMPFLYRPAHAVRRVTRFFLFLPRQLAAAVNSFLLFGVLFCLLLPPSLARPFYRTERYGMFILLGLIFILPMIGNQLGMDLNILGWILGPASDYLVQLIATLTGLKS